MVTYNGDKDPLRPPPPLVDITYKDIGAYSVNINIRRVAEIQMVSVRTRNIQGIDTLVYGTYNVGTRSFHLFVLFQLLQVQFRYRLKIPKQPEQDSGYTPKSKIFAPR